MKRCPLCHKEFEDEATHCDIDGRELEASDSQPTSGDEDQVKTLSGLITLEAPFEIERAIIIALSICDAVESLHGEGRTLGALQPRNISITDIDRKESRVHIRESKVPATAKEGWPDSAAAYLSPEAADREEITAHSDIYSIGIIFYEMLAGQPPFTASTPAAIFIKRALETPRPLPDLRPEIPEKLQQTILRALEKDASARQQSVAELKREIEEAREESSKASDAAIVAAPASFSAAQSAKASGISRNLILAALIGLAIGLASLAGVTFLSRGETAAPVGEMADTSPVAPPVENTGAAAAEESNANDSGGAAKSNQPPPQPKKAAPQPRRKPPAERPAQPEPAAEPAAEPEPQKPAPSKPDDNANRSQPDKQQPVQPQPDASPTEAPDKVAKRGVNRTPRRARKAPARPSPEPSGDNANRKQPDTPPDTRVAQAPPPPPKPDDANANRQQPDKPAESPEPAGDVAAKRPKPSAPAQPAQPQPTDGNANQPAQPAGTASPDADNSNSPPVIQSAQPSQSAQSPPESSAPVIPIVLAAAAIGAFTAFILLWRRRKAPAQQLPPKDAAEKETVSQPATPMAASKPEASPSLRAAPASAPPLAARSVTTGALAQGRPDIAETVKARGQETIKRCPTCQTEFPISVRFCVHEGIALEEVVKPRTPDKDPSFYDLQTLDTKKQCPQCGSEQANTRRFCPFDGRELVTISAPAQPVAQPESMDPFMLAQYRCFARLGEGGMGVVYKARDVDLDRLAAVKVLLPQTANLPDAAKMFRREAQLASSITHPNSVVIYGYGEASAKLFYMAMEFIPGKSLSEIIQPRGGLPRPLPLRQTLNITRQICDVLDTAHQAGIVHRDLKPQNVMVCERPNKPEMVKVVDFGIARSMTHRGEYETLSGTLTGTPAYMSPEQARMERNVDGRSDVFSLAAMVYQMMSGALPFPSEGMTIWQQIMQRATLEGPPSALNFQRPDLSIPAEADRVLRRALDPDRNRRTPSAGQFFDEFENAVRM